MSIKVVNNDKSGNQRDSEDKTNEFEMAKRIKCEKRKHDQIMDITPKWNIGMSLDVRRVFSKDRPL